MVERKSRKKERKGLLNGTRGEELGGKFWNIQDARQKRTEEKAEKIKIIKRTIDYYYHFMIETSTRTVVRWVFWVGLNPQFEKEGGGKVVDVLVEKRQIRAK